MDKIRKIVSIVGARPQFIKYGPLGRKLRENFKEILIHTGQHYDENMSGLLFRDLKIPEPEVNLNIGSHTHGKQTGLMLEGIEEELLRFKPDLVIVFGDTNSTLAGALAAAKLHIKTAHIEAGLRSFNKRMPEEINRILTDHCSDFLFCPTMNAVGNLREENILEGVYFTGDIMYEAFLENSRMAGNFTSLKFPSEPGLYFLATVHRAENTDNTGNLKNILESFGRLDSRVIFPVHPRTKKIIQDAGIKPADNILMTEPAGYFDLLTLLNNCRRVITDSGGLQKEAYFAKKFCITLRNETEWIETLKNEKNVLCGTDIEKIVSESVKEKTWEETEDQYFGDGKTSSHIINILKEYGI